MGRVDRTRRAQLVRLPRRRDELQERRRGHAGERRDRAPDDLVCELVVQHARAAARRVCVLRVVRGGDAQVHE